MEVQAPLRQFPAPLLPMQVVAEVGQTEPQLGRRVLEAAVQAQEMEELAVLALQILVAVLAVLAAQAAQAAQAALVSLSSR